MNKSIVIPGMDLHGKRFCRIDKLDQDRETVKGTAFPAADFRSILADKIASIDVTQLYDIVMYYTDQFEIQLGSTEELEYKIKYLAYALESLDGKSGLIDLTFDQDRIARFLPW